MDWMSGPIGRRWFFHADAALPAHRFSAGAA